MSGNDKKVRSVTIRLSEEMISRFEQMQERNRAIGKKASLSQVVREQLEGQGNGDRADSRIALAEQRKNAAKTLQGLRSRILNGVLLTRTEWEFLCSMAHDAYRYRNGPPFEGQLLSDAMKAFRAFYEFRRTEKGANISLDRYYLSNLHTESEENASVSTALDHTLSLIGEGATTHVDGKLMMRNLEVSLRDEPILPENGIQACFAPYGISLLTLAAKAYFLASSRICAERNPYIPLDLSSFPGLWTKELQRGPFSLHIHRLSDHFSVTFKLSDGKCEHVMSVNDVDDWIFSVTNSITESRYGVIDTTNVQGEQYVLNFPGEWRFYVTIDEYNQLRALIDDYLEEPEIRRVREFARLIYGAI